MRTVICALAALLSIVLAPRLAGAAAPPVKIQACFMTQNPSTGLVSGVTITYQNTGPAVLHHVKFRVNYTIYGANLSHAITDRGTFSPGVTISHHFSTFEGQTYSVSAPVCRAVSAS